MVDASKRSDTAKVILKAAKESLLDVGYAGISTRAIADLAGVPLSQIHYHFGSKQNLVLAVLEAENQRLLDRQQLMFESDLPLWKQWEQACDFLDDDLASGYVRVLHEMIAAGWSEPEIAQAVWGQLQGWYLLLTQVAEKAGRRLGGLGLFTPAEVGALAGLSFIGAESLILLGADEQTLPARSALRKLGLVIRTVEEAADAG